MPITYGKVFIKKSSTDIQKNSDTNSINEKKICYKCNLDIDDKNTMTCVNPKCNILCHIICFSSYFHADSKHIIPIEGECPSCNAHLLWGDLVRKKKGCYKNLIDDLISDMNLSEYKINV